MDGILVVAKEPGLHLARCRGAGPAPDRHASAPATAGRSIRSRPACCRLPGLATRLVEYHMGDDKAYRATVCFGATSETDDRDGELVPGSGPAPDARGRRGGPGRLPRP
jgi:hypothetical protein